MKKAVSFALVLILFLVSACACATKTIDSAETLESAAETTGIVPETDAYGRETVQSSIPAGLDLGGKTITYFIREAASIFSTTSEFIAESENGDPVNDAVYKRQQQTEDDLNVKIDIQVSSGTDYGAYETSVRKNHLAGDQPYDILASYAYFGTAMAGEGLLYNLCKLPYVNLAKPWWNKDFVDQLTLLGQLYFISGDLNLTATQCTNAMFFNKKMVSDYFGELNLYDVVNSGGWTIDYFGNLVKNVYADLNGNSQRDKDDSYGVGLNGVSIPVDAYLDAFDLPITTKNADGLPELSYNTDRMVSAYDKILALAHTNNGVDFESGITLENYYMMQDKFKADENMFLIDIFEVTDKLRDMVSDYGVLPLFKYDEAQKGYYTNAADVYSLLSVTVDTADANVTGAVFEYMSQKSYELTKPAYFEIALKQKYSRANDDAKMYDLILDGLRFNFGFVYSASIGNVSQLWRSLLDSNSDKIVSTYASIEKSSNKLLDQLIKKYQGMAEK